MSLRVVAVLALLAALAMACGSGGAAAPPAASPSLAASTASPAQGSAPGQPGTPLARPAAPAHTVIVLMENHSYAEVIGSPQALYLNQLARRGALFTDSRAITHPRQPNFLALFSGSTQGVTDDSCPHRFTAANLGSELIAAGRSFAGYVQDRPAAGPAVCASGGHRPRDHRYLEMRRWRHG